MNKTINILLTAIICLVPLIYLPFLETPLLSFSIKAICLFGLSAFLFVFCFIKGFKQLDKVDIAFLIFISLNILSTLFSANKKISVLGLTSSYRYDGLLSLLCYFVIYYASKYYFSSFKATKILLILTASFICFVAIFQFVSFQQLNIDTNYTLGIAMGTLGNSNYMGSFCLLFLPIFICLFFFNNKYSSFVNLLLCAIFGLTIILTSCRSAWLGLAFFLLLFFVYAIKNFNKNLCFKIGILVLIFIVAIFMVIFFENYTGNHIISFKVKSLINDFASLKNGISLELGTARLKIWNMVIPVIKNEPLLGCGPDNLPLGLYKHSTKPFLKWIMESGTFVDKAHNDYLQIAACTRNSFVNSLFSVFILCFKTKYKIYV